ncbi:MarR family winged helix-turn-helix transcriptional regulator [Cellulomonas endophytica]|uniref:MarR family winged helix-turn-helix transcriptional regulator n=1 Tax=Cellulomonas endophytica TaxID=2494735 RepID=UPI001011B6C0|nr:MarR family winged helix-turn-helix transcriptional regulator [Cellulomonas endophytica]
MTGGGGGRGSVRRANEAWEALFRAQATLAREFEAADYWGDVSPRDYGLLYALAGQADGVRVTDLTRDVLLTQAGVSRLVGRLEARGLVARLGDPDDGRASRVVLTEAGRAAQRRVGRAHARHVTEAMTRALAPEQLEVLRGLTTDLSLATPRTDGSPGTRRGHG